MKKILAALAGIALFAAPALALDPRVPGLCQQVLEDGRKSHEFAKDHLHPLRLRHLQIRSALNDFSHWAGVLAEDAARPGVDPGIIHHGLRNLEMWGGTIDYHLNPSDSPAIEKVRARWAQTKAIWNELKVAAGFRPGQPVARDAERHANFEAIYLEP